MGGGLLQLVAYGAQDTYLSGNPQITFFKLAYRRHTNFAIESIQQTFSGTADFGRRVTCQISRNGDLINRVYLQTTLPELPSLLDSGNVVSIYKWTRRAGLALIKSVELEIGGQSIDKQYGDWMFIWNELTIPSGKRDGFNKMIGYAVPPDNINATTRTIPETTLYIPLEFWFCRNPGLAIPLIALQYHEVKIHMEFRSLSEMNREGSDPIVGKHLGRTSLWVDYVFLDTDERRRFAQTSHEYLIEQLQFTGAETSVLGVQTMSSKLNFNHPVKEIVWVAQYGDLIADNQWFNYTNTTQLFSTDATNICKSATLQLNGHDRFVERSGEYFNLVQPYQHHTNVPSSVGISVYSFALRPEEAQPSGSLNFSRIDSAVLKLGLDVFGVVDDDTNTAGTTPRTINLRVYAVNYNILRIMSGLGGLAYSN